MKKQKIKFEDLKTYEQIAAITIYFIKNYLSIILETIALFASIILMYIVLYLQAPIIW